MCLCGVVVIGGVCYWWCSFYVGLMTSSMEWSCFFMFLSLGILKFFYNKVVDVSVTLAR